jgi:predicted homoserine dehydrogenase-like protein
VEVHAVAKPELDPSEVLDPYGMYLTYGDATNVDEMSSRRYLPEGLVAGCRLGRDISQDEVLTYDDVTLPQAGWPTSSAPSSIGTFRGER